MEHITKESIKEFEEFIRNKPYYNNPLSKGGSYEIFEQEITNKMLEILHNDKKFQEFSKQTMNKIILGEL